MTGHFETIVVDGVAFEGPKSAVDEIKRILVPFNVLEKTEAPPSEPLLDPEPPGMPGTPDETTEPAVHVEPDTVEPPIDPPVDDPAPSEPEPDDPEEDDTEPVSGPIN